MAKKKPTKEPKPDLPEKVDPTVDQIVLELDELDSRWVREALEVRLTAFNGLLPDGGGNLDGRVIAEICRGWLEMLRKPTRGKQQKEVPIEA